MRLSLQGSAFIQAEGQTKIPRLQQLCSPRNSRGRDTTGSGAGGFDFQSKHRVRPAVQPVAKEISVGIVVLPGTELVHLRGCHVSLMEPL